MESPGRRHCHLSLSMISCHSHSIYQLARNYRGIYVRIIYFITFLALLVVNNQLVILLL